MATDGLMRKDVETETSSCECRAATTWSGYASRGPTSPVEADLTPDRAGPDIWEPGVTRSDDGWDCWSFWSGAKNMHMAAAGWPVWAGYALNRHPRRFTAPEPGPYGRMHWTKSNKLTARPTPPGAQKRAADGTPGPASRSSRWRLATEDFCDGSAATTAGHPVLRCHSHAAYPNLSVIGTARLKTPPHGQI